MTTVARAPSPVTWSLARERIHSLWTELWPLLQAHWHEIAHYQDIPLNPDFVAYEQAEEAGMLRVFTARDGGELVGYCAFFVRTNLHYCTSLQAAQDVLFVHPNWRGSGEAARFIAWCEQQLQDEGVQVVFQHLKVATPHTIRQFERMGYEPIDVVLGKRLDGRVGGIHDRGRPGGSGGVVRDGQVPETSGRHEADGDGA